MQFSGEQEAAIKAVKEWHRLSPGKPFYLAGYAGTGKTTLAKHMAEIVGGTGKTLYAAFTGKAALVLRGKGCDDASTIHSLIYRRHENEETGKVTWSINRDSEAAKAKIIVIDEVSMVDEKLGADLMSFGRPVLVLGDPAQLPPVKGTGYFTSNRPDMMLTEVHRQARDNPIIRMSMDVRSGQRLFAGNYGSSRIMPRKDAVLSDFTTADQVICGMNRTRRKLISDLREADNRRSATPEKGERLICLKNNRDKGLLNGSQWIAGNPKAKAGYIDMRVEPQDEGMKPTDVSVPSEFFTGDEKQIPEDVRRYCDEFDFAHAITCHKSQGSQWPHIAIVDESRSFEHIGQPGDGKRWLYTAITRASERVTVLQ